MPRIHLSHLAILISARWSATIFFPYRRGLTSMQHTASQAASVQPSSIRLTKGLAWLLALTELGMDCTEGDTMKTTINNISNITFIEL